jgi:RNA polymerase sigma factor (sigma-70 family)
MPIGFRWPDDPGYEAFVRAHGETLLRLAALLTGNRDDAQWSRVRGDTALAYMRTAVSRKAIDLRRRQRSAGVEPEEGFAEDPGFVRLEADAEFVGMLSALPDRQRAVLVLRYYADLDDAAVAKTLGCTVQTVRSQASRALAKLRARLVSADGGADAPAAASASTPVTEGRA